MATLANIVLAVSKLIIACLTVAGVLVFGAIIWAANEIDGLRALISPWTIIPTVIALTLVLRGQIAKQRMAAPGPF